MVVVSVPSYFSSPSPEIPLIMSDYKENGYNHRKAEQMLEETHLRHGHQLCTCYCPTHSGCCEMEVESIQRLENQALFQRFKAYEAIVAEDLSHTDALDEVLVRGIHPWLQRLGCKNGLCKGANSVYLMHGTERQAQFGAQRRAPHEVLLAEDARWALRQGPLLRHKHTQAMAGASSSVEWFWAGSNG